MREFLPSGSDNPTSFLASYKPEKKATMEVDPVVQDMMATDRQSEASGSRTHHTQAQSAKSSTGINSSSSASVPKATRRIGAPSSIPNFPSDQPRDHTLFSPSPSKSPPVANNPFKSPLATPPHPPSLGNLPTPTFNAGGMQSPWLALAAASGAPTPSLDGPGRNSPLLGSPFEKLNIGGSWSGANLSEAGRRGSLEPPTPFTLSSSPGKTAMNSNFSFGGALDSPKSKSMDNAKKDRDHAMAIDAPETSKKPPLPATLAMRRGSLPRNHVNIHGTSSAISASPLAAGSSQKAQPLAATALGPMMSSPKTLILDVRPPSSYQVSHLPLAHSLAIPSTLLRRPAFTIEKMLAMLNDESKRVVAEWRNKTDIVMIDQESAYVPAGSVLEGLAGKFVREGYTGHIWFVKGGHGAVRASGAGLVQSGEEEPAQVPTKGPTGGGLMAGGMGRVAFQNSSTGGGGVLSPSASMQSGGSQTPGLQLRLDPFDQQSKRGQSSPSTSKNSSSYRGHSAMGDDATASTLQPANPFFDNIRQNMELSHGGITDRIPLNLPPEIASRATELPSFLSGLASMSDQDAAAVLAKQFYQIELGEQKRLQAVMNWHTQDSGAMTKDKQAYQDRTQQSRDKEEVDRLAAWGVAQVNGSEDSAGGEYFPFSITAGVERGTKNRYKNIWPYDFSRVRLGSPEDDSDYINASFIQPRGTTRRYIATQGPMDATYRDFWTLVWEQNVQVIAMITKQFEGGSIKCGNYWEEKKYGPLRINQLSQTGGEDATRTANAGFDFGIPSSSPQTKDTAQAPHIKRVFEVTHDDHPEAFPRKIIQIQCVSWPDFDVPESADVLLDLIRDVDASFGEIYGAAKSLDRQDDPPVLIHCSAGVGRTGSFIMVDAILDGLRRERDLPAVQVLDPNGSANGNVVAPRPISSRHSSGESANPVATLERTAAIPTPIPEESETESENSAPRPMSLSHANVADHQRQSFLQHRQAGPGSGSANSTHSRPGSTGQSYTSFEHKSFGMMLSEGTTDFGSGRDMRATTASKAKGRAATPLSDMDSPILEILEGIRVQRMSLVQSLRQFVFVHRAIMTGYLKLLDKDPKRPVLSHSGSSGPTVLSIPNTASTSEDDSHSKRRASPTELIHDDPMFGLRDGQDVHPTVGGANLSKRPSFKKMRSSAVEGISATHASPGGSRRTSPKKGSS